MSNMSAKFILKAEVDPAIQNITKLKKEYKSTLSEIEKSTKLLYRKELQIKTRREEIAQKGANASKEWVARKKAEIKQLGFEKTTLLQTIRALNRRNEAKKVSINIEKENIQVQKKNISLYNKVSNSIDKTNQKNKQLINDTVRHIRRIESLVVAVYAFNRAYQSTIGAGIEYNKMIEKETIGMKLLIAQNLKNVDILGRTVTAQEKYTYAQKEASKAMTIVKNINVETPHTLQETLQIYKLLVPQVMKYGGSLQDVGKITKNVSVTASAMGIEFQQLLKTVDSLMSGQMKESGLKRAMEQFGISQTEVRKTIKNNGDVVKLFIDKLSQADVAGKEIGQSWEGITSKLHNSYSLLMGELSKPIFENIKKSMLELSTYLTQNKENIKVFVQNLTTLISAGLKLGGIWLSVNIAMKSYAKILGVLKILQIEYSRSVGISHMEALNYGRVVSANTISIKRMGMALKSFVATNPIMLGAIALMTAYNAITEKSRKTAERLSLAYRKTGEEIAKMSIIERNAIKHDIEAKISEMNDIRMRLLKGRYMGHGRGRNASYKPTEESKIRASQLQDEIDKQKELLAKFRDFTPEMGKLLKKIDMLKKAREQEERIVSKLTAQLEYNKSLTSEEIIKKRKQIEIAKENISIQDKQILNSEHLLAQMGYTKIEAKGVANAVRDITKELANATNRAVSFANILLQAKKARGEISKRDSIKVKYDLALKTAGDDPLKKYQAQMEYQTAMILLEKEFNKKKKDEVKLTKELEISNLIAHGNKKEALKKQIELIKDEVKLTKEQKTLKIDTLLAQNKSKIYKSKISSLKKYNSDALKLEREKENAEYQLFVATHTKKEVALLNLGNKLKGLGKYLKQAELAKIYEYEIKKMEKATNAFVDILSAGIQKALKGDFSGGLKDIFGSFVSNSTSSVGGALKSGLGSLFNGGSFFKSFSNISPASWIGTALSVVGGLFSTNVSQAELNYVRGRSNYSDTTLTELTKITKDTQIPLLDVTYKMSEYLKNMDNNFSSIAISLGATTGTLNLTGSDFIAQQSSVLFGIYKSSTQLIGSGLQFYSQTLKDYMDAQSIALQGFTTTLTTKSYLFGLITRTSINTNYTNLPSDVKNKIANVFADGYNTIMTSGVMLGLDKATLSDSLLNTKIDLGRISLKGLTDKQISDRLSSAFGEAFNAIVNNIRGFDYLLGRYAKSGETSLQTIGRISVEYEQAMKQLENVGKRITNINSQFGKQTQVLDIVKYSGGLQNFTDNINLFKQNYYTDAQRFNMSVSDLQSSFNTLGVQMPTITNSAKVSKDNFKNMINSIDTSTEAGAKLYAQMLKLSKSFSDTANSAENLANANASSLSTISSAWLGSLSYLDLNQKTLFATKYFEMTRANNNISSLDASRVLAEQSIKTTARKEDYIPIFQKYINELENKAKDATNNDLLKALNKLSDEVVKLRNTNIDIAVHSPSVAVV